MQLRYMHLPNYGVLKNLIVRFAGESLFNQTGKLYREGNLHFVVGLNGTGKSSLLRAIYETFRWLEGISDKSIDPRIPFPFPVTIVYELPGTRVGFWRTCVFHHDGDSASGGFLFIANTNNQLDETLHGDWSGWIDWLADSENEKDTSDLGTLIRSNDLQGNNKVATSLPNPMLVYTSGSLAIWNRVQEPELPSEDLSALTNEFPPEDERPRGWDVHKELASVDSMGDKARSLLKAFIDPNSFATKARCRLLEPIDLKLAATSLGLTVLAGEATRLLDGRDRILFREELIRQVEAQRKGVRPDDKTSRTLFNEVDWWFPTHLTIQYPKLHHDFIEKMNSEWRAQLIVLCALAEEVIGQPMKRRQLIINLGLRPITVRDAIKTAYGKRDMPVQVNEVIDRVEGSTSGAQAVLRTLCTDEPSRYESNKEPEFARWPSFDRLQCWRQARLIEDVSVTVKRVTQIQAIDGDLDDVVVTWEDLSDGEQMLLGRMALLMLLSNQHGSLLLLDEPETHFNDSWKREIIDIIDDNILKSTAAHVIEATHTSIALTDAFASEIIRLIREDGKSVLKPVTIPTFGASPSQVMTHVFDMQASIGSRAEQALRWYMERGTDNTVSELETLLANIGNGWPMAKLQKILDELNNATPNS